RGEGAPADVATASPAERAARLATWWRRPATDLGRPGPRLRRPRERRRHEWRIPCLPGADPAARAPLGDQACEPGAGEAGRSVPSSPAGTAPDGMGRSQRRAVRAMADAR